MGMRRCCCGGEIIPVNCECCDIDWDTSVYTGDWVVDFGVGGWTDVDGSLCNEINGEITLPVVGYTCPSVNWLIFPADTFDCDGSPMSIGRSIQLFIFAFDCASPPTSWQYRVNIQYWQTPGPDSFAEYSGGGSGADCLSAFVGGAKLTLTKSTEYHNTHCSTPVRQSCAGLLPATIDIWPEAA